MIQIFSHSFSQILKIVKIKNHVVDLMSLTKPELCRK